MSNKEPKKCALEGCEEFYIARVHNQQYHSSECTRIATNAKILASYHEKKKRNMKNRVCGYKGCDTVLSIYNQGAKCSLHERAL